jgi:serine/threonine-protein kinase
MFGRYRLLTELARGGMGEVHVADQLGAAGVRKRCVLKMVRRSLARDEEFVRMFLDEAHLAAQLHHPNVVETYEVGEANACLFIAMELLEGRTLQDLREKLASEPPLRSLAIQIRVLCDTLAGLHHAHELEVDGKKLEIVHRDMSPHNVFVTFEGVSKVLDFGIAKSVNASHQTSTGMFKGKFPYMAPEQLTGLPLDRRVDVFAVGVQLHEAITGKRFWQGRTDSQILSALFAGDVPRLADRELPVDIPGELRVLCDRATDGERDDRFATASAFQEALEDLVERTPELRMTHAALARWMQEHCSTDRERMKERIAAASSRLIRTDGEGAEAAFPLSSGRIASASGTARSALGDATPRAQRFEASGGTFDPMATPLGTLKIEAAPPRPKKLALAAVALACVGSVFAGWGLARSRSPEARPVAAAPPVAEPAPVASDRPEKASTHPFTLTIRSTPENAEVFEAGKPIGTTPITIEVEPESVVSSPRIFQIRKDGFLPYTVAQGMATADVVVSAKLDEMPAAPTPEPSRSSRRRGATGAPAPLATQEPAARGATNVVQESTPKAPQPAANPFADRY